MAMAVQYPDTRPRQRLVVLMGLLTTLSAAATLAQNVLLEAEQFTDIGGWVSISSPWTRWAHPICSRMAWVCR